MAYGTLAAKQMPRQAVVPRKMGPGAGYAAPSSGFVAPTYLLERARKRVEAVLLVLAALFAVAVAGGALVALIRGEPLRRYLSVGDLALLVVATSALLAARSSRLGDRSVLRLGLGLEILLCLVISYGNAQHIYMENGHLPLLTPTSIIIVMFPLIVPSRPIHTFVVSLLAAASAPLGVWLIDLELQAGFVLDDYAHVTMLPLACVAIATFGSRVIYGISLDVAKARRMGSYELTERLGVGGMGEVWRAEHQLLARPAAIKLVKPEVLGGDASATSALQRFEREAHVTANLSSEHTVTLYDFGVTESGVFYYVMELLHGFDLDRLVREFGPLPPERVVNVLQQTCESLAEAHHAGLIHRDIKPANVHISRRGLKPDFVKVLDFGLVALQPELRVDSPQLTVENRFLGTPAFMAPEMVTDVDNVDGRADIYALGCVAFWLLTGEMVFTERSPSAMIVAHATQEPAAPSDWVPGTPSELDDIVLSCLQKDASNRPESAEELGCALADTGLAREWTNERALRWWDEHGVPAQPEH